MGSLIADIGQVTPDWLTGVLRRSGALNEGEVEDVTWREAGYQSSRNYHLDVDYSTDTPSSAETSFFLKLSRRDTPATGSEVDFYTKVAGSMPDPPMVTCYDAVYSSTERAYHVLLKDVGETHRMAFDEYPLAPRVADAGRIVDALADLHAHWWDHPSLDGGVAVLPDEETIGSYMAHQESGLPGTFETMGDRLSEGRRQLLEQVFLSHPEAMIRRARQSRNLTLVHGDASGLNFLVPRGPEGRTYIIDRELFDWCLQSWVGVSDLSYLMVHWWFPERRRTLEAELLRRYLERLKRNGVQSYSWEDLWEDYRLAAVQSLYVPVQMAGDPASIRFWYPQLEHALVAFDDLGCRELVE